MINIQEFAIWLGKTKMESDGMAPVPANGRVLKAALWLAQFVVFAAFCAFGAMKLTMPIDQLAPTMAWAAEFPPLAVRTIGLIDLAGGIGIFLPALLRIRPSLVVPAAAGCTALQICAMTFHIMRGESRVIGLNIVLLTLAVFILWGHRRMIRR